MQESTLNKIRRVLNLGESTSQTTYSDLFRYHDDMYHQKPRPGNQIHTKLHDPIHDRLRRRAAAQHYNVTGGERLTSKDGKSYPPPEFKTESTGVRKATKADLEYMIQDHERQAHIVATSSPNSIRPVTRQALAAHHKRKAIEYRELLAKHFPDTKNESTERVYGEAKKEEEDEPKTSSVKPKAHHWNNAKKAYGVPESVPYHAIGGYGIDDAGNKVSKKELVRRHAFGAAAGAAKYASQFSREQKRAYIQAKIAKAVAAQIAAKKARGLGESTDVDHEDKFWNHIRLAYKSLSVTRARQHSSLAIDHAKKHFEKTGKKIDAEGILDGLPTGHESYLKY